MTREAINELKKYALGKKNTEKVEISVLQLNRVIKALEQSSYNSVKTDLKSCTDAISRQSAIFLASDLKQDLPDDEHLTDMVMAHNEGVSEYQTQLSLLPSVAPQPKTGQWIRVTDKTGHLVWECDKCGWQQRFNTNFCPDCGCRMIEPQERSDEE